MKKKRKKDKKNQSSAAYDWLVVGTYVHVRTVRS